MTESNDESFSTLEEEYEFAVDLSKKGEYHHSCFYAQQIGVKAAKDALNEFGLSRDKGSVTTLVDDLKTVTEVPPDMLKTAQILDGCYIPPAYPDASGPIALRGQYTKERANEALRHARKMLDFTEKVISDQGEKRKRSIKSSKTSRRT